MTASPLPQSLPLRVITPDGKRIPIEDLLRTSGSTRLGRLLARYERRLTGRRRVCRR